MQVLPNDVKDRRRWRLIVDLNPFHRGNPPKERDLPLGVPPGVAGNQFLRPLEIRLVPGWGRTDLEELPVADGLHPRIIPAVPRLHQPFHLPGQSGGKHLRHPSVDPSVQIGAVPEQTDHRRLHTCPSLPGRTVRGEGPSGGVVHLQRPEDPIAVIAVNARCSRGIDPGKFCQEWLYPFPVETRLQLLPERLVHPGSAGKTEKVRLEIEGGASREDRCRAATGDLPDESIRLLDEASNVPPLPGIEHVDEVVRDRGPLSGSRLGRSDIETAVDLTGVGGDDFEGMVRKAGGQRSKRRGLANAGRPEEDQGPG